MCTVPVSFEKEEQMQNARTGGKTYFKHADQQLRPTANAISIPETNLTNYFPKLIACAKWN